MHIGLVKSRTSGPNWSARKISNHTNRAAAKDWRRLPPFLFIVSGKSVPGIFRVMVHKNAVARVSCGEKR
jgi:hypothetical protein